MKAFKTRQEAEKLIGREVVIKNASNSHRIPVGTKVIITGVSWGATCYFYHNEGSTSLTASNFDLPVQTVAQFEKELKSLKETFKKEENLLKAKIDYMKETDSQEFDEDEFKAYSVLSLVESSKSKKEKAQLIAKLIKN